MNVTVTSALHGALLLLISCPAWADDYKLHSFQRQQLTDVYFSEGAIGDVNGDGRMDIIHSKGWFEQPESKADTSRWLSHEVSFSNAYGGAEMYSYDVDGDGDNDIITSHAAHDFGLAWYEQVKDGNADGLQLHSGGKTEVRYRNFRLEVLAVPTRQLQR